ncbi:MAG: peptide deformylase [Vagococcus sp.]
MIKHPHPSLTTPTVPVAYIDDELVDLLEEMYRIMKKYDGVGIAANQLGVNKRVALVEVDEESGLFEMINPKLVTGSGSNIDVEGCLSFPDVFGTVERYDDIVIRFVDRDGYEVEVEASGYLARAFQHELEHLDGKLFTDRIIDPITPEELPDYMEAHGYD